MPQIYAVCMKLTSNIIRGKLKGWNKIIMETLIQRKQE